MAILGFAPGHYVKHKEKPFHDEVFKIVKVFDDVLEVEATSQKLNAVLVGPIELFYHAKVDDIRGDINALKIRVDMLEKQVYRLMVDKEFEEVERKCNNS